MERKEFEERQLIEENRAATFIYPLAAVLVCFLLFIIALIVKWIW